MIRFLFLGLIYLFHSNLYSQDTVNCGLFVDSLTGIEHVLVPQYEPEFPGGQKELMKYLTENMEYPDSNVSGAGHIYVTFFVMNDGSIKNVEIRKTFDPLFSEPVIQVIENMPNWIPGKCGSTPVNVKFILPIIIN